MAFYRLGLNSSEDRKTLFPFYLYNMSFEKLCKNCKTKVGPSVKYCADCGQKYITGKPTLRNILGAFFSNIFNLDSDIYRSFWALFVPGKSTIAFLEGRTKSFAPPIRVLSLVLCFLLRLYHFL